MSWILEQISRAARRNPERTAYQAGSLSLSYGQLWSQAEAAARQLRRQGQSPVLLVGHKEPAMVVSILACLLAGRAYVPVDLWTPLPRLRAIAALSGASLALTQRSLTAPGLPVCALSDLPQAPREPAPQADLSPTAYIIFTSGSTGTPKGVPISPDNLDNFAQWLCGLPALGQPPGIRVLNQASFSFDLSAADLYYALCGGHTLVAWEGETDGVSSLIRQGDIHTAVMTPTFMDLCLLDRDFRRETCPAFRCVYFCGERLEQRTVKRLFRAFPDLTVLNAYGPTEAASAVSCISITPEMAETEPLLPVGRAGQFATDIRLESGEIVLRGRSVFRGYLGGLSGGHFTEGATQGYRTGDLGYFQDGKLYCTGRKDRQVKYKGYRIELDEIEQHLLLIPGVRACGVIAKRTPAGAVRTIQAFVALEPELDSDGVRRALAQTLPGYMLPKTIRVLDRLPVTANGKIDRKALDAL